MRLSSEILSPAKVNIGLRVVGRREDGYHQLESLFWPIDLQDEIFLEPSNENRVTMEWSEEAPFPVPLPPQEENSIYRLLSLVSDLGKWKVHVKKRIPLGGGLGGSSSNTGSVLREFLRQNLMTSQKSLELALRMGADVPFFLNPVPTWITGIGEERLPISISKDASQLKFTLLLFSNPCLTKEIFKLFKESNAPFSKKTSLPPFWSQETLREFMTRAGNDLEGVVATSRQDIHLALKSLKNLSFLYTGLSGSGSSCFGVSLSNAPSKKLSKDLQQICRKSNCRSIEVNTFDTLLHVDSTQAN